MIRPNPFTPKSGIEPKVFLNRKEEVNFFEQRIIEGKKEKFDHYVILGEWGIGKTALLKYLKNIAQKEKSYCSFFAAFKFPTGINPEKLALHVLQSIAKNLPIALKEKSNFLKTIKGFGIQVAGTGFNLDFGLSEKRFVDPQILLQEGLISLWKDIRKHTNLVTVLIDDVQNYKDVPEIFTLIKNVLSTDAILNATKFLFVLSSTLDGWKEFLIKNHPIGRYFIPRRNLKLFSEKDTKELILEILKDTGVKFSADVINQVWNYTQGHLFEIHSLCSVLYNAQIKGKVANNEWRAGFKDGLIYLGENVFDNILNEASETEKDILYVLSSFDKTATLEEIIKKCKQVGIKPKNVNTIVRRLTTKKIIQNPKRGCYIIQDKLLRKYVGLILK